MNRPPFIGNYKDFIEPDDHTYKGSDELLSINSPVGKKLGLQKIGVHIETLLPGRRTSWPHAERDEEEFVYIIEGNPSVWIDGDLYELKPGDFVAFPAWTGIAHTFMNNTLGICLLLAGGEASKKDFKVYYPLHPKRNEECKEKGSLWEDCPKRPLGPHDGIPKAGSKL